MKVLRSALLFMFLLLTISRAISEEKNVTSNQCNTTNLIGSPSNGFYNKIENVNKIDKLLEDINYQSNDQAPALQYQKTLHSSDTVMNNKFTDDISKPLFGLGFGRKNPDENGIGRSIDNMSPKVSEENGFYAVPGNEDASQEYKYIWKEKGLHIDPNSGDASRINKILRYELPPGSLETAEKNGISGDESNMGQEVSKENGFYAVLDNGNGSHRNKLFYCRPPADSLRIARCSEIFGGGNNVGQQINEQKSAETGFGSGIESGEGERFSKGIDAGYRAGFDDSSSGKLGSKIHLGCGQKLFDSLLITFFSGRK